MQEAGRLLDARLPIPAYGQLLRLSQAFNVLDARGVVGVTERATCFAAMRGLARRVARALSDPYCIIFFLSKLLCIYPMSCECMQSCGWSGGRSWGSRWGLAEAPTAPPPPRLGAEGAADVAAADLVVEIGCEELPPRRCRAAVAQLR